MSAAPAAPAADTEETQIVPSKKRNWKKLLVIAVGVLVAFSLIAGGRVYWLHKKRAADELAEERDEDDSEQVDASYKQDKKRAPPVFLALDMFTVNLADRDADRYAQIGITLEVDDAKVAEEMRIYMPIIRNNILMVLAQKTSTELLEREGKVKLAAQIRREAARGFGIYVGDDDDGAVKAVAAKADPKPVTMAASSAKAVANVVGASSVKVGPAASGVVGTASAASAVAAGSASAPASGAMPAASGASAPKPGASGAAAKPASGAKPTSMPASVAPMKKLKLKRPEEHNPIVRVHFSNFIIQ